MLARRVHLVRHGVTEWNQVKRFQGHTDVPLTADGHAQARAIAERLAHFPIAHIISSDLSRAFDTATPIAERLSLPLESDFDLREANKGELEGAYRDPETGLLGDETRSFDENNVHARPPGGESIVQLRDRCCGFMRRIQGRSPDLSEGDLLFVTHGGTMRAMMTVLLNLPVESSGSFHFDNCGLTTVQLRGDAPPLLVCYNDCQHLEVPAGT